MPALLGWDRWGMWDLWGRR